MRDLFFLAIFVSLFFPSFMLPAVAGLGYVWTELVIPQELSYSFMNGLPLNLIFALLSIASYLLAPVKHLPQKRLLIYLLLIWGCWITLTTSWAVVPHHAWLKWDWASKVVLFSAFFPFLFRTRLQIEAFFLTIMFSVGVIFMGGAAKTLLGGGGYGVAFGLTSNTNSGLSEGSTLSLFCVMLLPIILFMLRHSVIFPKGYVRLATFSGMFISCIVTTIGTHARTGLVCLIVYGLVLIIAYRRFSYCVYVGLAVVIGLYLAPADWKARMLTIEHYDEDASAMTRLSVWRWTVDFALEHPFGGGFDSFRINEITTSVVDPRTGELVEKTTGAMRAFHNVYLEVLGEQGFVGIVIFLAIILLTLKELVDARRYARRVEELAWLGRLAGAMITSIIVFLVGANFIGIAMQPFLYYFVAMTVVLADLRQRHAQANPGLSGARSRGRSGGRKPLGGGGAPPWLDHVLKGPAPGGPKPGYLSRLVRPGGQRRAAAPR